MTLDQAAHHVGFACRAERRTHFLGLFDPDQAIDDIAARHQQAVHLLVDRIDLLAQLLQRRRGGGRFRHLKTWRRLSSHP
jgi:hypothetical protein